MLQFLPAPLKGVLAFLMLSVNVLFWFVLLIAVALPKLLLPIARVRTVMDRLLSLIGEGWISGNGVWMRMTQETKWEVEGVDALESHGWYLVVSNHQSWADIFVLQRVLNRRIPLLKFFLKRELLWVPVMGLAWWALDFPFLKRHGSDVLALHPEKRGQDVQTTRQACRRFARTPTSVMNFPEGTRYSADKHQQQASPYRNLLRPKVGGIALSVRALGKRFESLIDVTIVYPSGAPTFWEFLSGRVPRTIVKVRSLPIPKELMQGDYDLDQELRAKYRDWVQAFWAEKDRTIDVLKQI